MRIEKCQEYFFGNWSNFSRGILKHLSTLNYFLKKDEKALISSRPKPPYIHPLSVCLSDTKYESFS